MVRGFRLFVAMFHGHGPPFFHADSAHSCSVANSQTTNIPLAYIWHHTLRPLAPHSQI